MHLILHYCGVSLLPHLSVTAVLVLLGETSVAQSNLRELTPQSRITIDNKIKNSIFCLHSYLDCGRGVSKLASLIKKLQLRNDREVRVIQVL
ncbi:MAG: hypothetical protein LBG48_04980 [Rickettsiales bacterium]|nr:hypothetical protein [Rickettsiales bacterium]